jgi:hypothetical protein
LPIDSAALRAPVSRLLTFIFFRVYTTWASVHLLLIPYSNKVSVN